MNLTLEALQAIATAENWVFHYGRGDHHNLFDELETGVTHLFLDPVEKDTNHNEAGWAEEQTERGSFLLIYSSDIDEATYKERFDNIQADYSAAIAAIKEYLNCNYSVKINQWNEKEVINLFDYNFDGYLIGFNFTYNL